MILLNLDLITILNIIGIAAFAVSGALKGMKHHLDILGVVVLGIITALGGGILRDVMMVTLPSSLINERDIYFAIIASLITYFAGKHLRNLAGIIRVFDAAGLAVFTVIGAEKGYSGGLGVLGVIIMGTVTGVAGGVVRDICVAEIPFILREEVYAVFCISGAFIFWLLSLLDLPHHFTVWPVILFIFAGRIIAIYFNLHLPRRRI